MCGGGGADPIKYTPEMKELAKISVEQYNVSKDYEYLKDDLEKRVDDMDTQGATDFVQGKANLGNQKAYGQAIDQARTGLQLNGVDPSSGRSTSLETDMHSGMGEGGAKGLSDAAFEKDSQALAGQQNVINIGMGKAGTAQMGLNDIANQSVSSAIDSAFNDFNEHSANAQALGTAAGLGTSAYQYSQSRKD